MWIMIYGDISMWCGDYGHWGDFQCSETVQETFIPFPFELFKIQNSEIPNWMLWLAQDGVWFPVDTNLRKPLLISSGINHNRTRREQNETLFILLWWNPRKREPRWFSTGSEDNQDPNRKGFFQGKALLWFIPCSSAQSSTWQLWLLQLLPPESLLADGSSSHRRVLASNTNCKMYLLLTRYTF